MNLLLDIAVVVVDVVVLDFAGLRIHVGLRNRFLMLADRGAVQGLADPLTRRSQ